MVEEKSNQRASMDLVVHPEGAFEVAGIKYRPEWGRHPIEVEAGMREGAIEEMVNAGVERLENCYAEHGRVPARVHVDSLTNVGYTVQHYWD